MLVQEFITKYGWEKLKEAPYFLEIREYEDRIVLNYSQINSPKHDPIVKECRALILHKGDWKVLSRTFDRFFNYEEDQNSKQFVPEYAWEKIDGSLISIYHDGDKWCAATRSMAYAEGLTVNGNTFLSVVEKAIGGQITVVFEGLDTNNTYIFEVVSPETRIVTPYSDYEMYLLAIRNKDTGDEYDITCLDKFPQLKRFKQPKRFSAKYIKEVIEMARELPAVNEGYVCTSTINSTQWRIKVKNPSYLAISHMRMNGVLSNKRIAYLVVNADEEEYLEYFPEDRKHFAPYQIALSKAMDEIEELSKYLSIEDKKEFALKVKDTRVGFVMFALKKGLTIDKIFSKMTDDGCLMFLEKYLVNDASAKAVISAIEMVEEKEKTEETSLNVQVKYEQF